MIKLVGYILLFISSQAYSLVPVEGIILGEAKESLQQDPLRKVFGNIYDQTQMGEKVKLKNYLNTFEKGAYLKESCGYLTPSRYATQWAEKQAKRSVVATLQYLGLDTTIKAIGAYAKKLDIGQDDYYQLSKNLVRNYCSKNITVISLKNIEKALGHYYENPQYEYLPSLEKSSFATSVVKTSSDKLSTRSSEFDLVIKNFRAFCSWGGEIEDLRLLTPYLSNSFIMAFVIKDMAGVAETIDETTLEVKETISESTIQVSCQDLVCRNVSQQDFKKMFPLSVGSTGVRTDLSKLYCHYFRFLNPPQDTLPEVKKWIKESELEDSVFETSQFIALMTGIPDLFNGASSYRDVALFAKSSIDDRWTNWAMDVLNASSKDLLYEDALKIKILPRSRVKISLEGFGLDFSVGMGEIDNLLSEQDKIDLQFELKLTKNFLRSIKTKWKILEDSVDLAGQEEYKKEIARYVEIQLKEKQKYFKQKMWNENFSYLIAEELIRQTRLYRGAIFTSFQDEVLKVPVRFSYGLFALSYLRYRLSKSTPPLSP